MKQENEMSQNGNCPICNALITPERDIEDNEVLTCLDCQSILISWPGQDSWSVLEESLQMGEDWECN